MPDLTTEVESPFFFALSIIHLETQLSNIYDFDKNVKNLKLSIEFMFFNLKLTIFSEKVENFKFPLYL